MQISPQKYSVNSEKELDELDISLKIWDRVFFYGDLWAWKTTLIRSLLKKFLHDPAIVVRSPTYTYYQKYSSDLCPLYHFDLYRLEDYSTWVSIGGEEISDTRDNILLIEWPEILGSSISPTKKITITREDDESRTIEIEMMEVSQK